ncbi:MAG: YceD family protein [Bacteriovoracaceae bacterium]
MQKNEKIGAQINLLKLAANHTMDFEFDQETDWIRDMLLELNENASDKTPQEWLKETSLVIFGELTKKNKADLGEFVVVKGTIEATYATECVRTLKPMKLDLDVPFKIAFIDQSLSETELFKDIDETYVDNDVYEIYFYDQRTIDFQEMIHEQIFLHVNQYPVLDADSKLDGVDTPEA